MFGQWDWALSLVEHMPFTTLCRNSLGEASGLLGWREVALVDQNNDGVLSFLEAHV